MGTLTALDCREEKDDTEPLALVRVAGHLLEILLMSDCLSAFEDVTDSDAILSSASRRKLPGKRVSTLRSSGANRKCLRAHGR